MAFSPSRGKLVFLALIASLAFNAGVGATFGVRTYKQYADRDCDRPGKGKLFDALNLTEAQTVHVDEMRQEMRQEMRELRTSFKDENRALAELMTADDPDRAAIDARIQVLGLMHQRMQVKLVEHFLDIKAVLEPDQIEAFNETIARVLSHGGPGRGRHGGGDRSRGKGPRGERRGAVERNGD